MPRADGSIKILEKINGNTYKLELPPEFGISPTFKILDLKPHFGEEDELESRMTPIQKEEDDMDIIPSHIDNDPALNIQGLIIRAHAR